MLLNTGLLICCCLPPIFIQTTMKSGENLARTEPEVGESRADLRLPFYTAGFE